MATERKKRILTWEEKREKERVQQYLDNRKMRFEEILGKDCSYIDTLTVRTDISPWDVKNLKDKNCPDELIPKILL